MYFNDFTDPQLEELRTDRAFLKEMIKQSSISIVETKKGNTEMKTLDEKLNFPVLPQQLEPIKNRLKIIEELIEKRKDELLEQG